MKIFRFLLVIGCLLYSIQSALASIPCQCENKLWISIHDNAENVPINPKILVQAEGLEQKDIKLFAMKDGKEVGEVPSELKAADGAPHQFWLTPKKILEANTTYRLSLTKLTLKRHFKTGSTEDKGKPSVQSIKMTDGRMNGACGQHTSAGIDPVGLKDDVTDHKGLFFRVTIKSGSSEKSFYLPRSSLFIGQDQWEKSKCLTNYPAAKLGQKYKVKIEIFDLAGNSLQVQEEKEFEFSQHKQFSGYVDGPNGCACSSLEGSKASSNTTLLLAVLFLLLLFRMRHRQLS